MCELNINFCEINKNNTPAFSDKCIEVNLSSVFVCNSVKLRIVSVEVF